MFHIRSLAVSCRGGSPRASHRLEAVAGKTVDSGEMFWLAVHVG